MEIWSNPFNWTIYQWIAVAILAFIILAIFVLVQRLLTIIKMTKKEPYKPNLRRFRSDTGSGGAGQDKNENQKE